MKTLAIGPRMTCAPFKAGLRKAAKLWPFRLKCRHVLHVHDMERTGILPPTEPDKSDHEAWNAYFEELWHGDYNTKRIMCKCRKCGEIVYGHCGLDIINTWTREDEKA